MWSGSDCCKSRNILDISDLETVIINMHPSFRSIFKSMGNDGRVYPVTYKSTQCTTHIRCRVIRRYNKVPNLGLGPKWDQGAKMVPKKSQFYFQVPNFWFYLQMMLKRGGTYVAVRAQQWLFGHTQCMYHVHIFDTLWPSHIYWYILNWAMSRQRVFLLLLHFFFCLFMKITTKAPEKLKNGPKKVPILPKILSPKSHILY